MKYFFEMLHVAITSVVYIFCLIRHKSLFQVSFLFLLVSVSFYKQEMRYCSDDAPRTWERNVKLNKNTSENVASNTGFHPDKRAPSFIFKQV